MALAVFGWVVGQCKTMTDSETAAIEKAMVERAIKVLPEGCGPEYPLRTRLVICSQIVENVGQEVPKYMMDKGEPEDANEADKNLARAEVERGLSALSLLVHLLS